MISSPKPASRHSFESCNLGWTEGRNVHIDARWSADRQTANITASDAPRRLGQQLLDAARLSHPCPVLISAWDQTLLMLGGLLGFARLRSALVASPRSVVWRWDGSLRIYAMAPVQACQRLPGPRPIIMQKAECRGGYPVADRVCHR